MEKNSLKKEQGFKDTPKKLKTQKLLEENIEDLCDIDEKQ